MTLGWRLIEFGIVAAICAGMIGLPGVIIAVETRKSVGKPIKGAVVAGLLFGALFSALPVGHFSGQQQSPFDVYRLTDSEWGRLVDIVRGVIDDQEYLTPQTHNEFWVLLNKCGRPSASDLGLLRMVLSNGEISYNRYYYQDALRSLETGTPFKSKERTNYERELLSKHLVSEDFLRRNDGMMTSIASKVSVQTSDGLNLLDPTAIRTILDHLDLADRRLDVLFTSP